MAVPVSSILGEQGRRLTLTDPDTGREWAVSYISHRLMAEYEQWLRGEALKAAMGQRGLVPDDVYKELLRETTQDVASGAYAYEGELCRRSLETPGGATALATLMLWDDRQQRHPTREEMADLMRRRSAEVNAVIAIVAEDSRQKLRPQGGGGENPPRAATTTGTSAPSSPPPSNG